MDEFGSPIAGGLRGIRRSVSSGVFTGRAVPPPQPDRQTTNLLSQNSLALGSLTRQVNSVTAQVGALSKALEGVQQSLALNDRLERQREAARQRREAQLAEQGLREGKESAIEQKIQSALLKPVQAIATRAQGILGRVGKFLFAIAVIADDITAAFATVAFVAFISLLVDRTYTATQYALLASIGTAGRTTLASSSGALVDWLNGDWGTFFVLTTIMVIPSLICLWLIKNNIKIGAK